MSHWLLEQSLLVRQSQGGLSQLLIGCFSTVISLMRRMLDPRTLTKFKTLVKEILVSGLSLKDTTVFKQTRYNSTGVGQLLECEEVHTMGNMN